MSEDERLRTVGELLDCLRIFPDVMPVAAVYDCGAAEGSVVRVEIGPGVGNEGESVVLVIE